VPDELITNASDMAEEQPPYDTTVAHPARVYNYWLGGKDNFAADRVVGEQTKEAYPDIVIGVRAQRAFLASAVRYLVAAGVRQFLDIGTGLPVADNTHEVAQSLAPESRVVYVDNDRSKPGCTHERWAGQATAPWSRGQTRDRTRGAPH
jgi:hypothetical protein